VGASRSCGVFPGKSGNGKCCLASFFITLEEVIVMAIMELSRTEISAVSGGNIANAMGTLFGALTKKYKDAVMVQVNAFLAAFLKAFM
jgi:hypothetical protein